MKTCDAVFNFFPTHIQTTQKPTSQSMEYAPFSQRSRRSLETDYETDSRFIEQRSISHMAREAEHFRKELERSRKHNISHFPRQEIMSPFIIKRKKEYDAELEVINAMFPCAWTAFEKSVSVKSIRHRDRESNPCR